MLLSRCPVCEHVNPTGSKFCNACGAPLSLLPCPHCGAINDLRAGECRQCGGALSAPRDAEPAATASPRPTDSPSDAPARTDALVDALFELTLPGDEARRDDRRRPRYDSRSRDPSSPSPHRADADDPGRPLPTWPDEFDVYRRWDLGPRPGRVPDQDRPAGAAPRERGRTPEADRAATGAPPATTPRVAPAAEPAAPAPRRSAARPRYSVAVLIAIAIAVIALYVGYAYWQLSSEYPRAASVAREKSPAPTAARRPVTPAPALDEPAAPSREAAALPVAPAEKPGVETRPPTPASPRVEAPSSGSAAGAAPPESDASPIQRSVDVGPCTERVAALGLCTPSPAPRSP